MSKYIFSTIYFISDSKNQLKNLNKTLMKYEKETPEGTPFTLKNFLTRFFAEEKLIPFRFHNCEIDEIQELDPEENCFLITTVSENEGHSEDFYKFLKHNKSKYSDIRITFLEEDTLEETFRCYDPYRENFTDHDYFLAIQDFDDKNLKNISFHHTKMIREIQKLYQQMSNKDDLLQTFQVKGIGELKEKLKKLEKEIKEEQPKARIIINKTEKIKQLI